MAPAAAAGLSVTVTDDQGRPVPDAVVFLESAAAARASRPLTGVEMAQENKAFVPGVLVVPRGTAVTFPNRDTVRHHVYSFSPTKRFEIKLYIGTPAEPVVFDQSGVVVLGCNIHDEMIAWILVLETPWRAATGADGRALLADVPEGRYRLRVWHSRQPVGDTPTDQALTLGPGNASAAVRLRGLMP